MKIAVILTVNMYKEHFANVMNMVTGQAVGENMSPVFYFLV